MTPRPFVAATLVFGLSAGLAVQAQSNSPVSDRPTSKLDAVQVTATRFGEPIQEVPQSISVVTGDELRDRGATDLRTALALLSGVSVSPLSDAGPAAPVPNLLGIREVDDLLLLIDGVPAGGAYAPQTQAISLNNVERIELLRGAAPVYFGTTAFAGTINVIHFAAGRAENAAHFRYGSYGSVGASASAVLSTGEFRQSLAAEASDDRLSDAHARARRIEGTWRGSTEVGGGTLRADLGALSLQQKPTSPVPLDSVKGQLTSILPLDFNANPADGKIDIDRYQLVVGYERPLGFGLWGSTLAYTDTHTDSIRGFIDTGDTPGPFTNRTLADLEAFSQSLHRRDLFIDSHVTATVLPGLDLTSGVNLLLGRAEADSNRYNFRLLLDGSTLPNLAAGAGRGTVALDDDRRFVGLYAQGRYRLTSTASLLAGLRWNQAHETLDVIRVNRLGVRTATDASQDNHRLSGTLGAQWKIVATPIGPVDGVTLHASGGSTFQPAQIDFGPNPEAAPEGGGLLKPETQRSVVVGLRLDGLDGRADLDVDIFDVDFRNQPVQATVGGVSVLRAAGRQRYRGVDVEGSFVPAPAWTVKVNATWSDARFRDYVTEVDGLATQLSGKRQILAPGFRAGAGLIYAPPRGLRGALTSSYTGARYLDPSNRFRVGGFNVLDASLGYRYDRYTLTFSADNLTDRREPILASELGEGQFYRLTSRRYNVALTAAFR